MKRAPRLDANHADIRAEFEKHGCSVVSLASMGDGVPDFLIGVGLRNYLLEVKDGDKPPSQRKLTPKEAKFAKTWKGQWSVIESVSEVLTFVKAWKREIA